MATILPALHRVAYCEITRLRREILLVVVVGPGLFPNPGTKIIAKLLYGEMLLHPVMGMELRTKVSANGMDIDAQSFCGQI